MLSIGQNMFSGIYPIGLLIKATSATPPAGFTNED
jgi:hypothetical protein